MLHKQLFSRREKILAILCAVLLMTFVVVGFVLAKSETQEDELNLSPHIQTSDTK